MNSILSGLIGRKNPGEKEVKQSQQEQQLSNQQANLAELDKEKKRQLESVAFDDIINNNTYFIHFVDDLLQYNLPVYSCTYFKCYKKGEFESGNPSQTIKYLFGTCGSDRLIGLVSYGDTVKLFHNNSLHNFSKVVFVTSNFKSEETLISYLKTETQYKKLHSFDVITITKYPERIPQSGVAYPIFAPNKDVIHTLPSKGGSKRNRKSHKRRKTSKKT
jgi:hypothetical protein